MKSTDPPAPIGERIKVRRKKLGLTREALALLWHVAPTTVRNWEIGLVAPGEDNLAMVDKWLAETANGAKKR